MGLNTPDDATNCSFLRIHDEAPGSTVIDCFEDQLNGQDSHATGRSGPSCVAITGGAKSRRKALPDGRQVPEEGHR